MKVLLTGATGWVGRTLGLKLAQRGHSLVGLARDPESARENCPFPADWHSWSGTDSLPPDAAFRGIEAVIHLLGEPIAGQRWTEQVKKRIVSSRVDSTRALAAKVREHGIPVFISASAIGYYGDRGDEALDEDSAAGKGFLPEICSQWEREALGAQETSRCVALRIGVVLGKGGGALEKMLPIFRAGFGGPMASGNQWMSWIHLSDLQDLIIAALENPRYRGVLNATSPNPVRQKDFAKMLGEILNRPSFAWAPGFALKFILGEMAQVVLASQHVNPKRALAAGFVFKNADLSAALRDLLQPESRGEAELIEMQFVDRPPADVFPFYADESNLERITPPFLNFRVLGKSTPSLREGTLIDYRLKLYGLPYRWRTKIEDWSPSEKFVDSQMRGPYKLWHHTHLFEPLGRGTLIVDKVRYKLPLGCLGRLLAGWKVDRDVQAIFRFRRQVIAREIWPKRS